MNNKYFSKFWFFLSFSFIFMYFIMSFNNKNLLLIEWEFFLLYMFKLNISFIFDYIMMMMVIVVCFIAANIYLFAADYMNNDQSNHRFNSILSLFVLSMIILSSIPNLILMLIGWDGLGITSFLLVIYYSSPKALSSGMITALTNRLGDGMLMLSIIFLLNESNWDMSSILKFNSYYIMIILMIILGAFTKSAQIPFSSWLPAAMAAPTPVSALVHSSTLVTAGVYLLIRLHYYLNFWMYTNFIILFLAMMTMLMAGVNAIMEVDMKKVVALSTLSQLSVMMTCIGLNFTSLAFFHLLTHALFKSLMFISVGYMMLINFHNQDIRLFGNMNLNFLISSGLIISNLALMAWPFLSAFYTKDIMLELIFFSNFNTFTFFFIIIATSLTSTYAFRILMISSWSSSLFFSTHNFQDQIMYSYKPIILLSMGGIFSGAFLNWLIFQPFKMSFLTMKYVSFPIFLTVLGFSLALIIILNTSSKKKIENKFNSILLWFNMYMWTFSLTSSQPLIKKGGTVSTSIIMNMDQGFLVGILGKSFSDWNKKLMTLIIMYNKLSITLLFSISFFLSFIFMI